MLDITARNQRARRGLKDREKQNQKERIDRYIVLLSLEHARTGRQRSQRDHWDPRVGKYNK